MHASRNISMCTKDCVCLFVCPTGATDTDNGQIDAETCLDGCRRCVDACPSGAIYLVMDNYPEPPLKTPVLAELMAALLESKGGEELQAASLAAEAGAPGAKKLAEALRRSCRILAEDCAREGGYMLPGSLPVRRLLEEIRTGADPATAEIITRLLSQRI